MPRLTVQARTHESQAVPEADAEREDAGPAVESLDTAYAEERHGKASRTAIQRDKA